MSEGRTVKVTLAIDDKGAVSTLRSTGSESERSEGKLKHLDTQVKGLGKSFGGLKTMIGAGLGALGVGGVAYGIKDVVSGMQEMAGATEQFHAVSGIGAQQSLLVTSALKARGIDASMAGRSFGFMTKNLQTAERQWHTYGTAQQKAGEKGKVATGLLGVQATAFKELGINVAQLSGMSGEQKLHAVVEAFENMSPAMKKAGDQGRLMKQIFGKGGEGLATVLQGGALGLTAMTKAAKQFFPTLNVKQLEEMKVQTAYSNLAFEGLKFTLGQQLIPVLLEVDKWFVKTIREIEQGHGTWGKVGHDISAVAGFAVELWKGFEHLVGPTKAVELAIGGLMSVIVVSKIAGFVSALVGMAPALALIAPELIPIAALLAGIYEGYKHIQEINEFLHPTVHVWKNAKGKEEPFHDQKQATPRFSRIEDLQLIRGGVHGGPMAKQAAAEALAEMSKHAGSEHLSPQMASQAKIDLHIDGKQFAETVVRNPWAKRLLAESAAHYTLQMQARGGR